jgi:protein ImuB
LDGEQPDSAFALTQNERQTQILYAVCPQAAAFGLHKGMTLAEARAIKPDIYVEAAMPERDAQKLEELARWLVRYTPLVAVDGADAILLDVTGCPHLFGGEAMMLKAIRAQLAKAGIDAQIALAESRGAAWAFSHFHPGAHSADSDTTQHLLRNLPVRALRLDDATVRTLQRLGLKTVGLLSSLPRPALARRFRGMRSKDVTALLARLDQVQGKAEEPISPLQPLPSWQVRQAFAEPVLHLETIEIALDTLVAELVALLAAAEEGVSRLVLSAFRVDGSVQQILIGTNRPSREKKHLLRLFQEKLDQLEADFGFDLLILAAYETSRLVPTQWGGAQHSDEQSADELLDRLATRLGAGAVVRLKHRESHVPERTQTLTHAGDDALMWEASLAGKAPRPLRLLSRPESIDVMAEVPEGAPMRFRWRRKEHRVTKAEGPERIASEWWLNPEELTRDYYRVEIEQGARFWLFRRGLYKIPGVFSSEQTAGGSQPSWFMHGFFA